MTEVFLLPATIKTNGCWWLERSKVEEREQDHFEALQKWLENTDYDFVFCENSGADCSFLNPLIEKYGNRIELISYSDNDYDRSLGKGHGELRTINYALEHSTKLKKSTFIHKVSGRYYLSNIKNILDTLKSESREDFFDLIAYYHPPMFEYYVIPTVYFGMKRKVFDKYLKEALVNDAAGVYLEHTLFNAFTQLPKEKVCFFEIMGLAPDQRSGTGNAVITHLK